jgi:iduronate 2-sulfatase
MGKIFHPGADSGNDDPLSWSDPYFHGTANFENRQKSWDAVPDTDLVSRPLRDMQVADEAIDRIRELAASDETFFLAVGFHKPHEPFVFPESFFSNYSADSISLPDNDKAPDQMPEVAWSTYSGLRTFQDIEVFNPTGDIGTVLPDDVVKDLRRAYYATVSYIDTLVGKIYDELEAQQLLDDTIISLVGDHGDQLGEHGEWGKRTNFELSTHAPMMIRVPGKTENGIVTEQLVEFVDLFPTLSEAAGLGTIPQCPENSENEALCHEGESLMPLIDNPDTPIKEAAFSQTPSPYPGSGRIMGYTMRTEQYRYTEWVAFRYSTINEPNWNQVSGVELYDHINDSDENFNIAASADPSLVSELSQQLRDGWRKADPTAKRILDVQENTDAENNNEKSLLQRLYYFLSHWK